MSKPMKPEAIDINQVAHDKMKIKKYKTGQESKQVRMWYSDKKSELLVQTPKSKVPFGLSIRTKGDKKEENENDKYMKGRGFIWPTDPSEKYELSFNADGTDELKEFKKFMITLNDKNVKYIHTQSLDWWGKKMSEETICELGYGSLIKESKDKTYPDRFKAKLPFYEGKPQFKVYNQLNQLIEWVTFQEGKPPVLDWSWCVRGMYVETIIECEGLWDVNKKVYCTWKVRQIRVTPPDVLQDCAFDDTPSAISSSVAVPASAVPASVHAPPHDDLHVEDDDDEEEDLDEDDGDA